jgi:hypothetical protein
MIFILSYPYPVLNVFSGKDYQSAIRRRFVRGLYQGTLSGVPTLVFFNARLQALRG